MKKKLKLLVELFEIISPSIEQFKILKEISEGQQEILIKLKEMKMQANEFELQLAGIQAVFEKAFAEVVEEVAGLQAEIAAAQNANAQLPESLLARAANLAALAQKFDELNADKVEEVPVTEVPVEVPVLIEEAPVVEEVPVTEVPAPLEAPVEFSIPVEETPAQ